MFRIGSALYIPSYLTVTLYRPFASANDDGSTALMTGERFVLCRRPTWIDHFPISPRIQHVSFLDTNFSLVDHGHTGQARSDTAEQLSRTPQSQFSSITVRVSVVRSDFWAHRACFVVSPPHVVGYANGIAQSIVSLSRFLGPILGGTVSCSIHCWRTQTYCP